METDGDGGFWRPGREGPVQSNAAGVYVSSAVNWTGRGIAARIATAAEAAGATVDPPTARETAATSIAAGTSAETTPRAVGPAEATAAPTDENTGA